MAERTGLTIDAAAKAAKRRFTEPGLWLGPEDMLPAFLNALAEQGVHTRRGGRFLTLSFGSTKADRMAEIAAQYSDPAEQTVVVALGDAPNDVEMIEAADYGVIIANELGAGIPILEGEAAGQIRRTQEEGPKGWNQAILDILSELGG